MRFRNPKILTEEEKYETKTKHRTQRNYKCYPIPVALSFTLDLHIHIEN